ncbi:MAG: glucose-1-phosphate cytidylyltransferase [Candidatus Melainabacteria bacterium]|nr:glucose-1-phosphate cytidylyltransferase [Candidatus Melainabacteria bacterium]
MKAVILAGGFGTRISEETTWPKPMVEIGGSRYSGIFKIYSHYGINDFVICCGYKGFMIKEYFANYFLHTADVTFDMLRQTTEIHQNTAEPWRVTLVDTGENTNTGGRLKRVSSYLGGSRFCLTYGDGVADVNITKLIDYHVQGGALVTTTAYQPPGRFGSLNISESGLVDHFVEKPSGDGGWINAGFFVMEPGFLDYIEGDETSLEQKALEKAARDGKLSAFKHRGFWQAMDTLRDNMQLNKLWDAGRHRGEPGTTRLSSWPKNRLDAASRSANFYDIYEVTDQATCQSLINRG